MTAIGNLKHLIDFHITHNNPITLIAYPPRNVLPCKETTFLYLFFALSQKKEKKKYLFFAFLSYKIKYRLNFLVGILNFLVGTADKVNA